MDEFRGTLMSRIVFVPKDPNYRSFRGFPPAPPALGGPEEHVVELIVTAIFYADVGRLINSVDVGLELTTNT